MYSRDSKILASAGVDNTIKLWDTTGKRIKTLATVELIKETIDNTIKIWNINFDI